METQNDVKRKMENETSVHCAESDG